MTLTPVSLEGTYFSTHERRFIPVGAHWVPAKAALQWPYQWDLSSIETDFAKMKDLGFNTVRIDLFWAWFEPRPGDYNPQPCDHPALYRCPDNHPISTLLSKQPVCRRHDHLGTRVF